MVLSRVVLGLLLLTAIVLAVMDGQNDRRCGGNYAASPDIGSYAAPPCVGHS